MDQLVYMNFGEPEHHRCPECCWGVWGDKNHTEMCCSLYNFNCQPDHYCKSWEPIMPEHKRLSTIEFDVIPMMPEYDPNNPKNDDGI